MEKKTMKKLFIALLLVLLALPFAYAANPHYSTIFTTNGLIINSMFPDSIKQNQNYTFFWYVQNQSNSAFINQSISCSLELYKMTGFNGLHVASVPGTFDGVEEYYAFVEKGNFSLVGDYIERVKCNSSLNTGLGGIVDNTLKVTKTGADYSGINFLAIIFSLFGVIIILLILAYFLSENHGLLAAVLAGIGFYALIPLLNIGLLAFENNFVDAGITNMINTLSIILTWTDYAVIVYIVVYIFIKVISGYNQDKKEKIEGLR
jgi:hypothetical protein